MTRRYLLAVAVALGGCNARDRTSAPAPRPADDMVLIPAGSFVSGCDATQGCDSRMTTLGAPQTRTLAAFEIDRLEVAVGDYRACWRVGPCATASDVIWARTDPRPGHWLWPTALANPDIPDDHPIVDVSALEAQYYCAWVGKRLPTALEWEKAARGTDGRPYPWGWEPPTRERTSTALYYHEFPLPRGFHPLGASPYGVLDMIGNATEWVTADDGAPEHVLVAGGNTGQPDELNMLPAINEVRSAVRRGRATGFRCARSVAGAPPPR